MVSGEKQRDLGQFFTDPSIAAFMADSLCDRLPSKNTHLRILDPGAGTGILACAVAEEICARRMANSIEIVAYEVDQSLNRVLASSLDNAKLWLAERFIPCEYQVIQDDFILANSGHLERQRSLLHVDDSQRGTFDCIIMNPPYFKISKNDPRAVAALSVVHGQPNIYALFMAVAAAMLSPQGCFVSITPRSFAAGPYFSRFRQTFFSMLQPVALHLFGSRRDAFSEDAVLQENVILVARSVPEHHAHEKVIVTSSMGIEDLGDATKVEVCPDMVIDHSSTSKILHIPVNSADVQLLEYFRRWDGSLRDYGLEISTGPVVPFRSTEYLRSQADHTTVPLLWMHHVHPMAVSWPQRECNKPQYISNVDSSARLLVPDQTYVLLRRFSSKEQDRRLTAAPLFAGELGYGFIGIENHLNYIYGRVEQLTEEVAYALAALLNSELFDRYFRIFNGNTQVSATELRQMPLPSLSKIEKLGRLIASNSISPHSVDSMIMDWFWSPN